MKKFQYIRGALFFCIFTLVCISTEASQIFLGGQFGTSLSISHSIQSELTFLPQANLDLELFLLSGRNNEIKCAGYFLTDLIEKKN